MADTRTVLHENKWVSLHASSDPERGVDQFVFSHETRCGGKIVAVLPWRFNRDGNYTEILLHTENNPAWGWTPTDASVTGGQESEDPAEDAAREVREETGYQVTAENMRPLGTCRGVKSCDTVYSLFAVCLDDMEQGEVDADSLLEASEKPKWVPLGNMVDIVDPLVSVLVLRFMAKRWAWQEWA